MLCHSSSFHFHPYSGPRWKVQGIAVYRTQHLHTLYCFYFQTHFIKFVSKLLLLSNGLSSCNTYQTNLSNNVWKAAGHNLTVLYLYFPLQANQLSCISEVQFHTKLTCTYENPQEIIVSGNTRLKKRKERLNQNLHRRPPRKSNLIFKSILLKNTTHSVEEWILLCR